MVQKFDFSVFCCTQLFFPTNVPDDKSDFKPINRHLPVEPKNMTDLQILYHKIKLGSLSSAGGYSFTNCLVAILKIKTPSFKFSLQAVSSNV